MTEDAECFVAGGADFVGIEFLVVPSACHHPNLPHIPLYSCKWVSEVPMNIVL